MILGVKYCQRRVRENPVLLKPEELKHKLLRPSRTWGKIEGWTGVTLDS